MTNELEKQFFDTFGIESEEERYCYWQCKKPELENAVCNNAECEHYIHNFHYKLITDHHYLELLEILLNFEYIGLKKGKDHYSVDFQGWLEQRENSLRDAILKSLIVVANSEFKDVVYNDVRTLFEEG